MEVSLFCIQSLINSLSKVTKNHNKFALLLKSKKELDVLFEKVVNSDEKKEQAGKNLNIIVHGLKHSYTPKDLCDWIHKNLQVRIEVQRVQFLPIHSIHIVTLQSKREKSQIFRNCHLLKGKKIGITDDRSFEERLQRKLKSSDDQPKVQSPSPDNFQETRLHKDGIEAYIPSFVEPNENAVSTETKDDPSLNFDLPKIQSQDLSKNEKVALIPNSTLAKHSKPKIQFETQQSHQIQPTNVPNKSQVSSIPSVDKPYNAATSNCTSSHTKRNCLPTNFIQNQRSIQHHDSPTQIQDQSRNQKGKGKRKNLTDDNPTTTLSSSITHPALGPQSTLSPEEKSSFAAFLKNFHKQFGTPNSEILDSVYRSCRRSGFQFQYNK